MTRTLLAMLAVALLVAIGVVVATLLSARPTAGRDVPVRWEEFNGVPLVGTLVR